LNFQSKAILLVSRTQLGSALEGLVHLGQLAAKLAELGLFEPESSLGDKSARPHAEATLERVRIQPVAVAKDKRRIGRVGLEDNVHEPRAGTLSAQPGRHATRKEGNMARIDR
jgi:hypothetical protein